MEDRVYCGRLVSDDKLEHSSGPWKKHAYVKKTQEDGYVRYWYDVNNGKDPYNRTPEQRAKDKEAADKLREASYVDESYWQPDGPDGKEKGYMQNGATDKEIEAAENEYKAAEAAYRKNPSPNNRTRLNKAEEEVSRARAIKRRDGKYEEKSTKEELKKEAIRKGKELFSRSKESYRTVETRSMPNSSDSDDKMKKRKSLSLFNHGVRHTGSKKKESKSDEVLKLEPTGKVTNGTPTRQNRTSEQNQYYNGAFLSTGANRESYTSIGNKKPISRPKNIIGRRASKDAMDDFLQDHPNVHKNTDEKDKRDARLSTSIDASPVKDKKLRKQKVGRR